MAQPISVEMDSGSLVEYGYRRVIITVLAVMCALLEIVDTTIVNVALHEMTGTLGVTQQDISWVVTAYAIANVIIIPMTGWLGQQFGRRNYFIASIIVFTLASFFCGNSTNLWELVFFRVVQGLGGGALLVTAQTIITESYPKEKRGMAQAIYGMGVIVGPTLGPPLGGYIVDNFSWPYIFYINLPLGVIAALLAYGYLKSPKYGEKLSVSQVDWIGITLLIISVGSIQYVLEHGQQDDWFNSSSILGLSLISFFGIILFIWRELVYEYPVVNIRVLKNKNLMYGTILSFVLGFGLYGSTFIIPIYTQTVLGWNATQAGLLLVPGSIVTGFMMPFVGKMLQTSIPKKYFIAIGFFIFAIYSFWFRNLITDDTSREAMLPALILRGVGLGLLFVPVSMMSLAALKGKEVGDGASMTGMMRQLGGSFGIAIISTLLVRLTEKHRVNNLTYMDPSSPKVQETVTNFKMLFLREGFAPDVALQKAYGALQGTVLKASNVSSYMDISYYLGILFLVCVPCILLMRTKEPTGKVDMSEVH